LLVARVNIMYSKVYVDYQENFLINIKCHNYFTLPPFYVVGSYMKLVQISIRNNLNLVS
jgi:hypothetical protein